MRWRHRGRWRQGHLGDPPVEQDGGLRVYDDFNGAARTLRTGDVQLLVRGPRGGRRWVAWDSTDTPTQPDSEPQPNPASPKDDEVTLPERSRRDAAARRLDPLAPKSDKGLGL